MNMGVKVKNGTPLHGKSLCETCVHAQIQKGFRESEEHVLCTASYEGHRVPFPVRECTHYTEIKRQTLKQMEEIAWILSPGGTKRRAGFVAPPDVQKEERDFELILSDAASS
jgi:hypothetical protein